MPNVLQFIPKPTICSICNKPVDLTIAFTDRGGESVHGDCYAHMIRLRQITLEKWRRFARDKESLF
jgi:hypothetical protein